MTLPMARSTCRHGQYGGAPDPSTAIPQALATSRSAANVKSSWPIRVLPIPGSPSHSTIRGRLVERIVEGIAQHVELLVAPDERASHQCPLRVGTPQQ